MADVLIRQSEGDAPDTSLLWDSVWNPEAGVADWALAGAEPGNRGGLAATAILATAVTIALFTDRRVPADHPLAYLADGGDPRGWWGDGVDVRADLDETEMGSLLWLLERAPLTLPGGESVTLWAKQFAEEALLPLQRQGVVVKIDTEATVNEIANRLELTVQLYGRAGDRMFDGKFALVWQQVGR